ncbi:MAG: response regulator transcription factor, partial [Cyanobacteria bacterium P01_F01_bin.3]
MTPPSKRPDVAHSSPIRVLLVDDEAIVRYGLSSILQVDSTVEVVGEADNGEAAIAKVAELEPDIVLMDLDMPGMDGVTAIPKIHAVAPRTKILVLTAYTEDHYLTEAMRRGAAGYLLKNTPPDDLVMLLQVTHKGYMQLGPKVGE